MARIGVLLVGLHGATASTFAGGVLGMAAGVLPVQYGTTGLEPFKNLDLCSVNEIEVGGWDYVSGDLTSALTRHAILSEKTISDIRERSDSVTAIPAPRTTLDIPVESSHSQHWPPVSFSEAISRLGDEVVQFKQTHSLEQVVIIYLGSPHKKGTKPLSTIHLDRIMSTRNLDGLESVPSGLLYATAAAKVGASFVDFTPSETLETAGLLDFAASQGVQFAGRDGSTGQTMLKLAIAQMLKWRNIDVEAWFSENLIGNHDGYVLNLPGHSETKIKDKRDALDFQLASTVGDHSVRINYIPHWGDRKESWDAVECRGWIGNEISLRLNWRAGDSLLAGAMVLDLVRLIEYGSRFGKSGLQSQLAFFFKHPLGKETTSLADRFRLLTESYGEKHCSSQMPAR